MELGPEDVSLLERCSKGQFQYPNIYMYMYMTSPMRCLERKARQHNTTEIQSNTTQIRHVHAQSTVHYSYRHTHVHVRTNTYRHRKYVTCTCI